MSNRPEMADLLAFAHRLADVSAEAILPHFRNLERVEDKSAGAKFDPVTVADRAAEEVIRSEITAQWPDHGIIGEEFGETNADAEYCWIIDPIDGTRPFLTGFTAWGSLIGLLHGGKPCLGMMNQPFTGERFWAGPEGAFYKGPDGEKPLKTRNCEALGSAILTSTSPDMFVGSQDQEKFESLSNQVRMRWYGGDCLGYCLLASGLIDVVVESSLSSYDILPLVPIIEQAGGIITTWDGTPVTDGGSVIASGDPALHEQALKYLSG